MRIKSMGAYGRLNTVRTLFHRFAFAILVCASFILMAIGRTEGTLVIQTRAFVLDALTPVLDILSRPASAIANGLDGIHGVVQLHAENVRLQAENERLAHWQTVATQLASENTILRRQMNFIPDPDPAFVTARVIGDVGTGFGRSMLLSAGARDGVRKGQAVLSGESLVGYIAQVSERSSRLLLLTDINAHLPVMVESSHTRAILAGDNQDMPRLDYLPGNATLQLGDRVVTSASGAAFPPGMGIGVVVAGSDGASYRVQPFVRRDQLEFVTIVDYGLGGVLPFTDKPPPPPTPSRHRGADRAGGDN